ncbi:substrate-binding domain-containing protein [Alloscardovia criceti]|uniref:substrate-binding domain-containing protein n=1 Tax=Alloscardovia criceti TaxID=356828 RepID=UPI00038008C3|nr:substrate-binding domain-containing protein [Alloscardovia criceti]
MRAQLKKNIRTIVLLFLIFCVSLASSCASRTATSTSQNSSLTGTVDIITPTGSTILNSNAPLNTWTNVTSAMINSLKTQGFSDVQLSEYHNSDITKQTEQVSTITSTYASENDKNPHTLFIAPAQGVETQEALAIQSRYGDTVQLPELSSEETVSGSLTTEELNRGIALISNLKNALEQAQAQGIKVVLMSQKIPDFTEDYFVTFATPQSIARIQANNLVRKLQLDQATTQDPQAIEMFLSTNAGAEFNKEAFSAAWAILKPYFVTGVAYSPSGLMDAQTTDDDWRNITVADDSQTGITSALESRLTRNTDYFAQLDGVLAFNDYMAQSIVSALDSFGFTGSSASVNPNITLESIVNTLSGNADVQKQKVPHPQGASDTTSSQDSTTEDESETGTRNFAETDPVELTWPVITSYGAYINAIPSIVNGKIWVSAMEDRDEVSTSIAQLSVALSNSNTSDLASSVQFLSGTTITSPLFAVNADNLKKTLIDTKYITPAEAGL